MIACCCALGFAFSAVGAAELVEEFEPVVVTFAFDGADPVKPLSLSCSPQNVNANDINPSVSSDFIFSSGVFLSCHIVTAIAKKCNRAEMVQESLPQCVQQSNGDTLH